jgi:LPXTG-site transpeptidase (sortase) family protein
MKKNLLFFVLLISGAVLIAGGFYWQYHQQRVLSFQQNPYPEIPVVETITSTDQIISLQIESLDIFLPVFPATIRNEVWEINPEGVSHLISSANPGEGNNIVLYGHNKKALLGNLKNIDDGAIIELTMTNGRTYQYITESMIVVSPDEIELVLPSDYEKLTIYTCFGFADRERLVIVAKPL